MARAKNSFGPPIMRGNIRRAVAAGGRECRPGGQSLRDQAREERIQREIEAALTGEIWGAIGDRSGGGEKHNERSRKR